MKIPLAQLAREAGVRRKTARLRSIQPTRVLEGDLYAIYRDGIGVWEALAIALAARYEQPAEITTDADGRELSWLVDQAARTAEATVFYQTEKLGRWVSRVGEWHGAKTIAGVRSALGVDIEPYVRLTDVQPLPTDAIRNNVALIRNLNAQSRVSVEEILYDALVNRRSKKHLVDALAKAIGTTKVRARRIAGDQTHKLGIALTAYRNDQLGVKSYVWETQGDDRVRPVHRRRNGHVFEWSKPPFDGHPGFAINCRCSAAPIVEIR